MASVTVLQSSVNAMALHHYQMRVTLGKPASAALMTASVQQTLRYRPVVCVADGNSTSLNASSLPMDNTPRTILSMAYPSAL